MAELPAWVATALRRVRGLPRPALEAAFALAVMGFAVIVLADAGQLASAPSLALLAVLLAMTGCAVAAVRYPVAATLVACPVLFVSNLVDTSSAGDVATAPAVAVVFVLSYRLGSRALLWRSLAAAAAAAIAWDAYPFAFNPFGLVDTLGAWAVGAAVRAAGQAQAQLEERGRVLALAQQRQAAESVRYERTRIARELHDIVAHSVSVMVVQAGAGEYLAAADASAKAAALDAISDQAEQAAAEVARLFALLEPEPAAVPASLDGLVRRAQASGLAIGYRLSGERQWLAGAALGATYRLVQEALTNAVKHAPGAAIEIAVTCGPHGIGLVVTNGPPAAPGLGLSAAGGGHGIAGMRERVAAYGGRLEAGPQADGGWRLDAFLPVEVRLPVPPL